MTSFSQGLLTGTVICYYLIDPTLPDLPSSYQTNMQASFIDKGYSMDIVEYFDHVQNRAAYSTFRKGQQRQAIFSYDTEEVFYLSDGVCTVANISTAPDRDIFGEGLSHGKMTELPSKMALKFGKMFGEVYKGTNVSVNGIPADHWQSCISHGPLTFTVDYFFNQKNSWTTSSTYPQVPIRADVRGIEIQKNKTAYHFHHIYDFYGFIEHEGFDDRHFEIPSGIVCPGRINTKELPTLGSKYHYRQEIIVASWNSLVEHSEVWFDHDYKLARYDYRPDTAVPPFFTTNPLSEIHDYNVGVKYTRDNLLGNCTILPLRNNSIDATENITAYSNGSYSLHMKNSLQLFYLNHNFTYMGQKFVRGVQCDVYSAKVKRYQYPPTDFQQINDAILEYYFLSDTITDYPNPGTSLSKHVPYQLKVFAASFEVVYNFMDFDKEHPDLSHFDISSCYSANAKLQFELVLPGKYSPPYANDIKLNLRLTLASVMSIMPIRIQDLSLNYDNTNVYAGATILDRTPAFAQFTYIPRHEVEHKNEMVFYSVNDPIACSSLCVNNIQFDCLSFDYCISDQKSCHLSRRHIQDGQVLKNSTTCDHFSRSVNGPRVVEKTMLEAYDTLRKHVYSQDVTLDIQTNDGGTTVFKAVDVSTTFGYLVQKPMPTLPKQFSYHTTVVEPQLQMVFEVDTWYDYDYKLIRYDFHIPNTYPPFYTASPMTVIHDFNTGIAYNYDKIALNCTINHISNVTFDDNVNVQPGDGSYVVKLKDPLQLFSIDNKFKWAGQKTVDGILCDVFESEEERPYFKLPGVHKPFKSIFQYYFMNDDWIGLSTSTAASTASTPVRLDVIAAEPGFYITYRFSNFVLQHPDLSTFNILPCFPHSSQQKHFQIDLPGSYHPYLDRNEKKFQFLAIKELFRTTGASPLRFQNTMIEDGHGFIYIIGTIVSQAPFMDDFQKMPGKQAVRKPGGMYAGVTSATECADACISMLDFPCNSFDYCSSQNLCLVSQSHTDLHGVVLSKKQICDHYSRVVDSDSAVPPSIAEAFIKLKDYVYKGLFIIPLPYGNNKTKNYTATEVHNDIIRDNSRTISEGALFKKFKLYKTNAAIKNYDATFLGISVDDCATACVEEERFDCNSFDYCYATGTCLLYKVHPDQNPSIITQQNSCDLHARTYLYRFNLQPGQVIATKSDYTEPQTVANQDMCAKTCSEYTTFQCESFQYCAPLKQCRLMKKHFLDIPDTSIISDPDCYFYSRKVISDFKFIPQTEMDIKHDITLSNLTPDQCAKICIQEQNFNCKSFDFCGNVTECRLNSVHLKGSVNVSLKHNTMCDHYSRKYFPDGSKFNPNSSQKQVVTNTKADVGAMVGIAFGMLLPGVVLGAVLLHFFRAYRARQSDDMAMKMMN